MGVLDEIFAECDQCRAFHQHHHLETLVSTIADLTSAVQNLATAVAAIPPPNTGTQLDASDQAALDSAVTELDSVVTTLQGLATPPAS